MKKLFAILLLSLMLMPLGAAADSYTSLWKQFAAAQKKDHPLSQLKVLGKIAGKAQKEKAYGHLIKAQMCRLTTIATLSPDSLTSEVAELQHFEQCAVAAGDNVLAAIYQTALGQIYAHNPARFDGAKALAKSYFAKAMSHPHDLAQAFATGYKPYVEGGIDSKCFYDDMLHIVGMAADDYEGMHAYYDAHGKREAACLTALHIVKAKRRANDVGRVKKSKYVQQLDSLTQHYADLDVAGEIAIERYAYMEGADDVTADDKMNFINYALVKWGAWQRMNILRNAQRKLTLPSLHASLGSQIVVAGELRQVVLMAVNNIGEVRLSVRRLNIDATSPLVATDNIDYERLSKMVAGSAPDATDIRRYVGVPAYRTLRDTMQIAALPAGMYLVEVAADNATVPVERSLLRVSNLYPVQEALPGGRIRMAVLTASDGLPVPGAKVDIVTYGKDSEKPAITTYTCDENGECYISRTQGKDPDAYRVHTATDNALPTMRLGSRFYYYATKATIKQARIYTDRSIYRPGQTVHVALVAYSYDNTLFKGAAVAGQNITLTMRDANRKEVASKTVVSDDYGMATADFVLPQGALNGIYTVRSDYGQTAYANFSVEEYKRPTFRVEMGKPEGKYAAGDKATVRGKAVSFAGVPVQGASVAVSAVRRPAFFWRGYVAGDEPVEQVLTDTVRTDAEGCFSIKVPIKVPDSYEDHPHRYYDFVVQALATDIAGETQMGEINLPWSDHPTMLTCDVPGRVLRDSLHTISFAYINNAGQPIDADITFYIDGTKHTCKANHPARIDASKWTSAKHHLVAYCQGDTLTTSFITFCYDDRKVAVPTHDWFYQSAERFPADGSPVYIQIGSSDSIQHVVYTMVAGATIIEDGRAQLYREVRTRAISYKPEWGDGITLSMCWVKDGKAYQHTARIERPLPDARLNIKWTTFRDHLTPGQKQTWTLNITHPDGTPAKAQLLATLYDKALDQLRPHSTSFELPVYTNVPWMGWNGCTDNNVYIYSEMPMKFLDERALDFSHFTSCEWQYGYRLQYKEECAISTGAINASATRQPPTYRKLLMAKAGGAADGVVEPAVVMKSATDTANTPMRANLAETAFFYPGLVTDNKGNVNISFTLPESLTTWQLYAMAHDKDLNYGQIAAVAVAKKMLMIQPNMPRFVRRADCGTISARIYNLSDKSVRGVAKMQFINPDNNKVVYRKECRYNAKAGEQLSVNFDFDMRSITADGLLICRISTEAGAWSDGEQHYLAVVPQKEMQTNTKAFTLGENDKLCIDLKQMFGSADGNVLTVETTDNPAWMMIQALPALADADADNAISLASAYYANAISRNILHSVPEIKQTLTAWQKQTATIGGGAMQSRLQANAELKQLLLDETPWVLEAQREGEQQQMLLNYFDESLTNYRIVNNIAKLSLLQNEDGSFAWWKGMTGSTPLTGRVLQMLVRLNTMIGNQSETAGIVAAAFKFMDKQMAHEVQSMQQQQAKGLGMPVPSEQAIGYLYASTLAKRNMKGATLANYKYLLDLIATATPQLDICQKAMAAVVLADNGYRKQAADMLESIKQYMVMSNDMGRYFDTPKARYSWCDYRIPTQVAAIEALQMLTPDDKSTIDDMKRWLLQSKRTQAWTTPINTADAVYAFLNGNVAALKAEEAGGVELTLNGKKWTAPKAQAMVGYAKMVKSGTEMNNLIISKASGKMAWGAVYAQSMQSADSIAATATGMKVKREIVKNGVACTEGKVKLCIGDRIVVRIMVDADRDYDFVMIADKRAACLEPTAQLSGYREGCYCSTKDNATYFFFDSFAKGQHVVEQEYYVDRKGTYHTGTCTVQCAYSPEFGARTKAAKLVVE